ncbi:hypothetical protein [Streptomyces spinoverrucosus]|nr:hypothetical protein [Streptomyces spinoverrucosus]
MSGPTVAFDHRASTNGVSGRGSRAGASTVSNTDSGFAPPSGRHCR